MSSEQNGNSGSGPSSTQVRKKSWKMLHIGHALTYLLLVSTSKQQPSVCPAPGCGRRLNRPQDLERHFQTFHIPCWIFCPYPGCKWRGSRTDEFERHLDTQQCGPKPKEHQYQIYNAKMVTSWIKNSQGGDVVTNAQSLAVDLVKERAIVLGRQEWLDDPWGISQETIARRLRAT
jgi:hypothetical protein